MYITKNRKRKYFGKNFSFEEFIEYYKNNSTLIYNFENTKIIEGFRKIYESLKDGDGCLIFKEISSITCKFFNFKTKQNTPNGFRERGFTEEEIKEMEKKNVIHFLNTNGYLILASASSYNDSRVKAKIYEYPKCKLCGSELKYHFVPRLGLLSKPKCSNQSCETNKNSHLRWKYIYGEEVYEKALEKERNSKITNINYWVNKGYGEEEAKKIISEIQKKNNKLVKKRRPLKKGDRPDIFFRERSWNCVEHWVKNGYSEEEAREIISKKQKIISNQNHYNGPTCRTKEYWLKKGYSETEAKEKISELQHTFSLKKCVEKYGEVEGERIWRERQIKWQKTLHENRNFHVGYSAVSQKLFEEMTKFYPEERKDYIFYGSKNKEYSLWCVENKHAYVYDFTDLEQRKIIEFNGDIYHANPNLFNENDTPNPFRKDLTSKDLWEIDDFKKQFATDNGFEVLVIWESDYRDNPEGIIKNCLKFLNLC